MPLLLPSGGDIKAWTHASRHPDQHGAAGLQLDDYGRFPIYARRLAVSHGFHNGPWVSGNWGFFVPRDTTDRAHVSAEARDSP